MLTTMEDTDYQHPHSDQRIFISNFKSQNGEVIRNRNIHFEDSLQSESLVSDKNSQFSNLHIASQGDYNSKRKERADSTLQINLSSLQRNSVDLQNFKKDNNINFNKRFTKQKSFHYRSRTINPKDQEELTNQENTMENSSQCYNNKTQNCLGEETINMQRSHRMRKSMIKDENYKKFEKRLVMFTKIKIRLTNFYKKYTSIYRTKLLNRFIRLQFDDQSDIIPQQNINILSFIQPLLKLRIFQKLSNIPLIDPQSLIGFSIKLVLCICNFLYFYFFSLFIVYQVTDSFQTIVCKLINIIWIIEILYNLNIKVYQVNQVIQHRADIYLNYLKNKAFFDFGPLIMNMISNKSQQMRILLQLIQIIKFHNLILDSKEIKLQLCMRVRKYYQVQLFNLILKFFLIGHLISCLWYLLGIYEINFLGEDSSWFSSSVGNDMTWWKLYISALYWSLSLMTMGSNTCTTLLQTTFTTLVLLFTSIAFGYIITVIGIILSEMDQKDEDKRKDMSIINEYMRQRNISKKLQARVNINLQYFYENNYQQQQADDQIVLNKISIDLRDSLLIEYNKQILGKIGFLNKKFSPQTLQDLSLFLKEEYYLPNSIINYDKDNKDQYLMYIIDGEGKLLIAKIILIFSILLVDLFNIQRKDQVQHCLQENLKSGDFFGQISFFSGIPQDICAKSRLFTKIVKINRQDFLNVIKNNDKEYQQFCEIKDKIVNYQQYNDIDMKCKICQSKFHIQQNCPMVNLSHQDILIKVGSLEQIKQQNRIQFDRKTMVKDNSLGSLFYNQKSAKKLIEKFINEREQSILQSFQISSTDSSQYESQEDLDDYRDPSRVSRLDEQPIQKELESLTKTTISQLNIQKCDILSPRSKKLKSTNSSKLNSSINEIENLIYFNLKEQYKLIEHKSKFQQDQDSQEKINIEVTKLNSQQSISDNQKINLKSDNTNSDDTIYINNQKIQYINNSKQRGNNLKIQSKLQSILENNGNEDQGKRISLGLNDWRKLILTEFTKSFMNSDKILLRANSNASNKTYQYTALQKEQETSFNPWYFDQLKEYEYYFPQGNSRQQLQKYFRFLKKKIKQQQKLVKQNKKI